MWDLCHVYCICMHTHTHTLSFAQSHACYAVAVSSCGFGPSVFSVVLYVLAAGVVAACAFLLLLFVCLLVFLMVLHFVSSQRLWDVFCLVSAAVVARCLVYHCFLRLFSFHFCTVSFSLLSLFPCPPVRFCTITSIVTKINR